MSRVKRGIQRTKKRRKLRQLAKGFKWGRKNLTRLAKTAVTKSGVDAYVGRKQKKRNARALWQIKIGAAVRPAGLSYSKFIHLLKLSDIELDRKVLADLAVNNKDVFAEIVKVAQANDAVPRP